MNSDASLRAALTNAVAGDSISFTANISTASDLPAITQSITVNGNNFTLSGANSTANGNSALFVFSGTVAINNLTISQVTAQGGAGGNSAGGGAGLGGALFIGAQANVTVSNVSLLNNVAQGGNGGAPSAVRGGGGGGGLGGAGGSAGGGGGGVGNPGIGGGGGNPGGNGNLTGQNSGVTSAGSNGGGGPGGPSGTSGGGGGGAGATLSSGTDGGAGGFGGGGGGGAGVGNGGDAGLRPGNLKTLAGVKTFNLANPLAAGSGGFGGGGGAPGGRNEARGGGDGGFGGGGGAGKNAAGSGGFGAGAGDGAGGEGGGGGLGAGGAIFVQQGGTLTLAGNLSVNGNSVVGGTGGSAGAGNGSAFGSGIFLQGNSTIVFQPGAGQVQMVADVITDQNGSTLATTQTTKAPNTFALSSAQSLNLGSGGSGGITLNGPGTLVLSAVDTYTGPTTVTAGTLGVTGSIANSITTVSNGGTVAGSGTLGGLVAQAGGTVAPGALAPFTTLNVTGNASFAAGSIFLVNINGAGQNDKLLVTGTATLTGGTVQVLAGTGITAASRFTLLTASGGVTGAFAQVTASTNLAFLTPVLSEDANDVFLSFLLPGGAPPPPAFPSVAATPGQKATAAAVQALGSGPLFNAVIGQSAAGARQAFDALSGEIHATAVSAAFEDDRLPREAILDRLSQPLATPLLGVASTMTAAYASDLPTRKGQPVAPIEVRMYQPRLFDLWGQGFGDWGRGKGDGNAASFDRSIGGFIIGGDVSAIGFAGSEWRLGAAGGYTNDTVHVDQRLSSADFENVFGAIYAGASYGAVHVRAGAIYGSNSLSTSRSVVFPGFFDAESSNSGGTTAQGFGEAGYRLNLPGVSFGSFSVSHATLEPFVGAAAINIHLNGFNEIGGPAALTGLARNFDLATSTLGLRLQSNIDAPVPLTAHALLGWRRAYGDVVPSVVLAFQNASQSFSVSGVPIDRNALLVEAGLDYAVTSAAKLGIWYSGQYGERGFDNAVKAQLDVSF
ncbi:MAG: autotransporter domain-containing protein [Hyphomicrobiales bacterium]|nr:autotransporter domain-containing protein [Hyphomicrobiales bacterium]